MNLCHSYKAFVIFLFLSNTITAQWVQIPDVNFRNYLSTLFPDCINGELMNTQCAGVLNATGLYVNNSGSMGISNLTGIQYFVSLEVLYSNTFSEIEVLSEFPPNLTNLTIKFSSQYGIIPPLPSSLEYAFIYNGMMGEETVLPESLTWLRLEDTNISSFSSLPAVLSELRINNSPNLNSLPQLNPNLTILLLNNTGVSTLSSLPVTLIQLHLIHNNFSQLPELPASLQNLTALDNSLISIPMLPDGLTYLRYGGENFSETPVFVNTINTLMIEDTGPHAIVEWPENLVTLRALNSALINPLPEFPIGLMDIDIHHCGITSLPALPPSIFLVDVSHNQLTTLPEIPPSLSLLNCSYNLISCMPYLPPNMDGGPIPFGAGFYSEGNPLTCVANYINGGMDGYLYNFPICAPFDSENNPLGCDGSEGIFGRTFNGSDTNCIYSNGAPEFNNIPVMLYNNSGALIGQMSSSNTGLFGFYPEYGNYTLKIDTINKPFKVSCSNPGISQNVFTSVFNTLSQSNHFPLECKPGIDVGIKSIVKTGWVFPGQWHELIISAGDMSNWFGGNCAAGTSVELVIVVNGPMMDFDLSSSSIQPTLIEGNQFIFYTSDVNLWQDNIRLLLRTDTASLAGSEFCVSASINPIGNDLVPSNNTYETCYTTINSYDPNMKEVYPVEVLPGYHEYFTYSIYFQNTGNAPAFNIRLLDTLSTWLDLNSLEIVGASHPFTQTLNGKILQFYFNDIMLPDSSSNLSESIGYVQYRVKPIIGLLNGSAIFNTAYIYFDFNEPIITNTTVNLFTETLSDMNTWSHKQFRIYPNPSNGRFTVETSTHSRAQSYRVYDLSGRLVAQDRLSVAESTFIIDVNIPSGFYTLQVFTGGGQMEAYKIQLVR